MTFLRVNISTDKVPRTLTAKGHSNDFFLSIVSEVLCLCIFFTITSMVFSATHLNFPPFLDSLPCFPLIPLPCALGPGRTHSHRDSESSERYGSPKLSWLIPTLSPQCRQRQATLHPNTITPTLLRRKVVGGSGCYYRALSRLGSLFLCGLGYFTSLRRKLTESSEQRGASRFGALQSLTP